MVKVNLRDGTKKGDERFAELEGSVRCIEYPSTEKYPLSLKVDILDGTNSQFYIGFDKFDIEVIKQYFKDNQNG